MKFHGLPFVSTHNVVYVVIIFGAIGFYFLSKGISQLGKESQVEVGRTNVIYSVILLLMDAAIFYFYYFSIL